MRSPCASQLIFQIMLEKLKAFLQINNIIATNVEGQTDMISFSINGLNFIAIYNKDADSSFFQMMLPKIGSCHNWDEKLNKLNSSYKAGKVYSIDGKIWLSVETFVYGNIDYLALFGRMIATLQEMIKYYRKEYND